MPRPKSNLTEEEKREKRRQYKKEWSEKNKAKLQQQKKEYYEKNKEKFLQQRKEYYETNKGKISQYKKEYNEKHKEDIQFYKSKYYQEHREELINKNSIYKKSFNGSIKAKIICSKQDDIKYNRENNIDEDFVKELLQKQNNTCSRCKIKVKTDWEEPYDKEQYSVNRLDNSIGHIKSNCEITCWGCNDYLGRIDKRTN